MGIQARHYEMQARQHAITLEQQKDLRKSKEEEMEQNSRDLEMLARRAEIMERMQRASGPLQPPPPPVPVPPAAVAPEPLRNIITIRGTADKHKLLKAAPPEKHEHILRESGKAVKAAYISQGGCLMAQITEHALNVECYPDDQEQLLIELINNMVLKHNVRTGPLTVQKLAKDIPSYIKGGERARVLNIIEARAIAQMRAEKRLLAKSGKTQTFEEDDEKLLRSFLPDALREITTSGAAAQRSLRDVLPPQ
jgi:hypothetical protein